MSVRTLLGRNGGTPPRMGRSRNRGRGEMASKAAVSAASISMSSSGMVTQELGMIVRGGRYRGTSDVVETNMYFPRMDSGRSVFDSPLENIQGDLEYNKRFVKSCFHSTVAVCTKGQQINQRFHEAASSLLRNNRILLHRPKCVKVAWKDVEIEIDTESASS